MREIDILSSLQPYFIEDIDVNDIEKINELHERFKSDFFKDTVIVNGITVKVKPYKYSNSAKDGLPVKYEGFNEKFVHIITRTVKASTKKNASNIRVFDSKRANRVHWIKQILDNCDDKRITCFRYIENNGTEREYFWYRSKQYIVILEQILPDYTLITGFCVDPENTSYYQNKYIKREK